MGHELRRMLADSAPPTWTSVMRLVAYEIADRSPDPSQAQDSDWVSNGDDGTMALRSRVLMHDHENRRGEIVKGLVSYTGMSPRGIARALQALAEAGYEMRIQLADEDGKPVYTKHGQPVYACEGHAMRFKVVSLAGVPSNSQNPAESAPPQDLHPPADSAPGKDCPPAESAPLPPPEPDENDILSAQRLPESSASAPQSLTISSTVFPTEPLSHKTSDPTSANTSPAPADVEGVGVQGEGKPRFVPLPNAASAEAQRSLPNSNATAASAAGARLLSPLA